MFFPEKKDDPEPPSPTPIKRFNIRPLTKQCGMTYRGSENTMLGTGRQPFLVVVKIKGQKVCFGTLISPMHVLTLASCLMQPKVSTGLLLSFHTPKICHLWIIGLCENDMQYKPNFYCYQIHIF